MITSFSIKNFRCFPRLQLDGLRRINLLVGANNTGKTSLLEALFLNLGAHNPELCLRLNLWRGIQELLTTGEDMWGWLFYGKHTDTPIELVARNGDSIEHALTLQMSAPREFELIVSGQRELPMGASGPAASGSLDIPKSSKIRYSLELSDLVLEYRDSTGQRAISKAILQPDGSVKIEQAKIEKSRKGLFVPTQFRNFVQDAERFSKLKSTGRQHEVVAALQSVDSRLQSLDILAIGGHPVIHGDIGLGHLVPLPMMGEGINWILSIILAIANFPGGVVLIDEIENGLHFSALEKLWKGIDEAATRANVQIFATTHSRECILATRAASMADAELGITRLQYTGGQIEAVQLGPEHLDLVADMGLEIRA